ncbi:MAG: endonuclease/exonuclease/phosphatase family protein, partial [Planctomycetes bacterium]|nr:endonuclease/exonuclease/phosphatase family protein [Planctomycetota bacterium]
PRQQAQMDDLASAIEQTGGPLLVVGDFNSTPWSYALRALTARTGMVRETRNLVTWPLSFGGDDGLIRLFPFLPLDHVLSRGINVQSVRTGADDGSDHLPVVFTFSVPASKNP